MDEKQITDRLTRDLKELNALVETLNRATKHEYVDGWPWQSYAFSVSDMLCSISEKFKDDTWGRYFLDNKKLD